MFSRPCHRTFSLVIAAVLALSPAALAQESKAGAKQGGGEPFAGLVEGLKSSPGCLGIESARTASGKQVIFAWFKDKKAALAWYHSDVHRAMMKKFFGAEPKKSALRYVPDDSGPIMAIASITFTNKGTISGTNLPISQISIELYEALRGGANYGGTFAPPGVQIPATPPENEKSK